VHGHRGADSDQCPLKTTSFVPHIESKISILSKSTNPEPACTVQRFHAARRLRFFVPETSNRLSSEPVH
jgi:hypothetical protein